MTDASRLPLYLMIGISVLLHGFFLTGLPNLPWFTGPPDIFRLTRYVVRFAKPVPTPVPTLTQVAVAEPVPIEPAPIEPVADLQAPKPIERVETRPEPVVRPRVAPTPVKPVIPEPVERKKPRTASQREQVVEPSPKKQIATPTIGRQAPSRVSAAEPRTAAPVLPPAVVAPQPRQPVSAAALQAQAEQEQLMGEEEEDAVQAYLGLVFQKLESHKRYPRIAERSGLNGRVMLRFTVRWDGEVLNPEVVEVVGHESFRKAALQALARVGQLPGFPDEIGRRELLVEVPITYKLDDR